MRVLSLYLTRLLLARFALVLFATVSFLISFELLERSDNVLNASGGELTSLAIYALLRLPDFTAQLLPTATLLAAILTLAELTRHHELEVIWTAGIGPVSVIVGLLPVSLLLVIMQFAIDNWAVPPAMAEVRDMGIERFQRRNIADDSGAVWLRSDLDLVRIPAESAQSGELRNILVFRRDETGQLFEQLKAASATPSGTGWILHDVERFTTEAREHSQLPELFWPGQLELEQLALLSMEPNELGLEEIIARVTNRAYGQRRGEFYETWLHHRLASALVPLLTISLVISLAQFLRGRGTFGWIFVSAIGVSFGYLMFARTALAMGEVGLMPPWLAGWGPLLALTCLVGSLLVFREAGRTSLIPTTNSKGRAAASGRW